MSAIRYLYLFVIVFGRHCKKSANDDGPHMNVEPA